ncbi:uncharacterized protein [Diabrotica undecimpunctata]|uniref:uncharacterized protein n=1 Tax=Diabrotica undecimpunctata TaxID=50387 RepID=UPI003B63646B
MAMSTRSKRILSLVNISNETNLLFLPKYETTHGTSVTEQQIAIAGFSLDAQRGDIMISDDQDKTSGSEYIPSSSNSAVSENERFRKRKNNNKPNENNSHLKKNVILQNLVTQDSECRTKHTKKSKWIKTSSEQADAAKYSEAPDKKFIMDTFFESVQATHSKVRNLKEKNEKEDEDINGLYNSNTANYIGSKKFGEIKIGREQKCLRTNNGIPDEKSVMDTFLDSLHDVHSEEQNENVVEKDKKRISEETVKSTEASDKSILSYRKETTIKDTCIKVVAASNKDGKRIRDKTHVCFICDKSVIHMGRHFETLHSETSEVAKCLAYPKNSKERRAGFLELIRVGDFYHNCNVLATKIGELILMRRPTKNEAKFVKHSEYGPCPNCLGFCLKKHLWHHIKYVCTEKLNSEKYSEPKHVISESNALIHDIHGFGFTKDFHQSIVNSFIPDQIGEIAKNDPLILKYGSMQFEKYGKTQNELIRQNMRQLARLTVALRKLNKNPLQSLSDFLVPEKFDIIVQATKEVSITTVDDETSRPQFKIPSLALKIGYSLQKCISIERGSALRSGNVKRNKSLSSFMQLMKLEWNVRISSGAVATLNKRKMNAAQLLPITNDLLKLNKYIDTYILSAKDDIESEERNHKSWVRLATLVLSRIILFNKRRSGEAARMKMSDYINRPRWEDQSTDDIKESLTPIERKLADTLTVVEVEGKRGRKVPVILTPVIKESIDLLIRHRYQCNISLQNKYIFARSNPSLSHLRGHDCLNKTCEEVQLENASLISGTKLRKYVATVCQLFNMSENEYDWLARHLGHDIRVHREFYRLHESAVELTKVSRLLIAVDKGEASRFAGKRIEDISIEDLPYLEDEADIEPESEDENIEIDPNSVAGVPEVQTTKRRIAKKVSPLRKNRREKMNWSKEEKLAVLIFFRVNIKKGIVPNKEQCMQCIVDNKTTLERRNWKNIKDCVYNEIKACKRRKKH